MHDFTSSNSGKVNFPESRSCVTVVFFTSLHPKHDFYSKLVLVGRVALVFKVGYKLNIKPFNSFITNPITAR